MAAVATHPCRTARLSRGWEPVQVIGRMKIVAGRDRVVLPDTWLLVKLLFLWENQRVPVAGYYRTLLSRVFGDSL